MRRFAPIALALALVAAGLGCGGGGGGGSPTAPPPPPPPPPPPAQGVIFTAAGAAGANSISLAADNTSNLTSPFVVRVEAREVEDLYGVAFDLEYPRDLVLWSDGSFTEGTFLSENGAVDTTVIVERRPRGNLVVGITRLGKEPGASGSGTLLTLEFGVRGAGGTGALTFSGTTALDSEGERKADVAFLAGSLEVRP